MVKFPLTGFHIRLKQVLLAIIIQNMFNYSHVHLFCINQLYEQTIKNIFSKKKLKGVLGKVMPLQTEAVFFACSLEN